MGREIKFILCTVMTLLLVGCGGEDFALGGLAPAKSKNIFKPKFAEISKIEQQTNLLIPLQTKLPPVRPGEWRSFWKEGTQTPQTYASSFPVRITSDRPNLYVRRIGKMSRQDEQLFNLISEFLGIYFQCPVKIAPPVTLTQFPASARRKSRKTGININSIYLTDEILKPELPKDGWGVIGVTTYNISKSDGLSEQYGDSLLFARAAVISLYYLRTDNIQQYIMRALKGASHEASHMLSIPHCTTYLCNMNGRANLHEFDRSPLHLAPACLSKLLYATGADIGKRFSQLEHFAIKNHLPHEYRQYIQRAANIIATQK